MQPDALPDARPPETVEPDLASKPCDGVLGFDVAEHVDSTITMDPVSMHVIDLDGDGNLDLVSVGRADVGGLVVTRRGTGGGAFSTETITYAIEVSPSKPSEDDLLDAYHTTLRVDVDGDTRQDFVVVGDSTQTLLNPGDGTLVPRPRSGAGGVTVMLADFDYDGIPDAVVRQRNSLSPGTPVDYNRGLGDGTFASGGFTVTFDDVFGVAALDVDGDGNRDLVVDGQILSGHGDGTFGAPHTLGLAGGRSIIAHDVNGDGRLDVVGVMGGGSGFGRIYVAINNGDGTFTLQSSAVDVPNGYPKFADLDGDGHVDMMLANGEPSDPREVVVLGHGDGTFGPPQLYATGYAGNSLDGGGDVEVGDVDGDGILDLVSTDTGGGAYVLHGRCLPAPL